VNPDADADPALEPTSGLPTEATLFFGLGGFTFVIGLIYAVTTSMVGDFEAAGTAALWGVSAFAATFGTFLWRAVERIQGDFEALEEAHAAGDPAADEVLYLPTTSVWPFGVALGMALIGAGIPMGFWVMVPGVAIFGYSILGFAHQTRTRT
jgi:hypothetical protein